MSAPHPKTSLWLFVGLFLLAAGGQMVFGQERPRGGEPPSANTPALRLLRWKLRPAANFVGEQVTEFSGGRTSRQRVMGDTRGRLRIDFLTPEAVAGDVMLIAPDQFRNYRRRANTLDVAFWPTMWNEWEKRIERAIQEGLIRAEKVGEELVAGRNAAIIALTPTKTSEGPLRGEVKYWIDLETGIQLKHEITNANGLVSRSSIVSITVGPAANVTPQDFFPEFLKRAIVNPLFPRMLPSFRTVQEAGSRLPFRPVEPSTLPEGYRLSAVWVFEPSDDKWGGSGSVLLRYSNGVTHFSLYQHPFPGRKPPFGPQKRFDRPDQERNNIQRWRVETPNGAMLVVYIGYLTPEQTQALRASLR